MTRFSVEIVKGEVMLIKLVFILVVVLLVASAYTMSCEQEKASKMALLKATRDEVGDVSQEVMECNSALIAINNEIKTLRDQIVKKKREDLSGCRVKFNNELDNYKKIYKKWKGVELTQAEIDAFKRRLGINF
jgi:malonyl CoA-acyl carrier protein transacylase